jgi:amidase
MTGPWALDATALAAEIARGRLSAREAVSATLDRLEAVNPRINAITLTTAETALAAADAADAAQARGEALGPLHGVPVTTKINTDQAGLPTDNGIHAAAGLIAEQDSPVIANLKRAGAIVVGRTNAPVFSMRWFTDNSLHGRTLNPWNAGLTCGGSSGGAAAAVAAGIGPLSQGNDIGGSVRYPAYCCGIAGLRTTYGRVPALNFTAKGARSLSSHLMAVAGPIARSVRDLRLGLAAMAAGSPHDTRWVDAPLAGPPQPRRAALALDPTGDGVAPEVAEALRAAGKALAAAGYQVEEVAPPDLDGILSSLGPAIETYGDDNARLSLRLLIEGRTASGSLPDYLTALGERETRLRQWQLFLEQYPVLVMPVSAEPPLPIDYDLRDGATTARLIAAQRPLLAISVLGLPAVSVPAIHHAGSIPLGVQVVAGRYREDLCLAAAEAIEAHAGIRTPIDPIPA